jgi:hypothetical protein
MPLISLSDEVYALTSQRAAAAGFTSVEEYIVNVLSEEHADESSEPEPDLRHLFTPERMAKIQRAIESADAGRTLTLEQVDAELSKSRAEWLKSHPDVK